MFRLVLLAVVAAIAFPASAQVDLYLLDTRTGETRQVTSTPDRDEYNASFSNDGRRVVHDVVSFTSGFVHDLWITDVETGAGAPLPGGEGGNNAEWSPNGNAIVFDRFPYGDLTIYTLDAAGGTPTPIAAPGIDPSWSGNSRRVAYQNLTDGSVRTVAADGSDETIVVPGGSYPTWSPNNQYIAYTLFESSSASLYCVRVGPDGEPRSAPVRLTSGPFYDVQPSWADSRTVVFHSDRSGDPDIYAVDCRRPGEPVRIGGNPGTGDFDPGAQRHSVVYSGTALPPSTAAAARGRSGRSVAVAAAVGPNPFRGTAAVRVAVADAAPVLVEVFDVVGRRVATLVDATLPAGEHRVTWAPTEETPGVYVVRVRVGSEVTTHRLTRVR